MHDNGVTLQKKVLQNLDISYSYELAKRMEQYRSHPTLGYRPAGSKAEFETGEMLKTEMEKIGLSEVTKDAVTVDGWEFHKAALSYTNAAGETVSAELGAYQTTFVTDGPKEFSMMYLGKGTETDYQGKDVRDKLVLVEINQRDEWWINYPVYQAHLKGAAALIAVQSGGYGEIDDEALNAQDIAGPEDAPAFSISRKDAAGLLELLRDQEEITVTFDAESRVTRNCTTYNIVGRIPGKHPDRMVLLSAHYDSYFDGFQDDNAAVAMMLGIARSLVKGGYKPAHTLVFCAMAAEEWGIIDSKYDWSTGAYNQVFRVHPDWQGKVIADLNFELPAHAHNRQDAIRCTYEYADFIRQFTDSLTVPKEAYPDGITVLSPIETWSDDFSMAIAGIPSTVNDFSAGPFMQNYYHSQYDNQDVYQEAVYQFHHECYLKLIMAIDRLVLPPMNFSNTMNAVAESIHENALSFADPEQNVLLRNLQTITASAENIYDKICQINAKYATLSDSDARIAFRHKWEYAGLELLKTFRKAQDYLVRLNWQDEVIFPQEAASKNIRQLEKASRALSEGNITDALKALYRVDNNMYAFLFDEEVYYHFTEYILHQPKDRLMWGAGRIMHHENLYGIVQKLKQRMEEETPELDSEIRRLEAALRRQKAYYKDDIRYLNTSVNKLSAMLDNIYNNLLSF